MRHQHVIAIAARPKDAERSGLGAKLFLAAAANRALSAPDPRENQVFLADPDTDHGRTDRDNLS